MTSLFKQIDYASGIITHIEERLSLELPVSQQIGDLREDLLQVQYYDGHLILDVGWYPSFEASGTFKLVLIANYQWETPVYEARTTNLMVLKQAIQFTIDLAQTMHVSGPETP